MAITAQDVKQLKELTNCGMMDCKRALEETNGDVDAAIKYLREKGLAKVAKKSGRIAAEGLVYAKVDEAKKVGVVVEINVETDFAAKTERFIEFVEMVAQAVIDNDVADVDALKEVVPAGESEKIGDILNERIATIGENIQIRRFTRMTGDLYTYIHNGGGSLIGSMIKLESADANSDAVKAVAKDLLLQITASAPQFVQQSDVPASVIEAEKEVQLNLVKKENAESAKPKPENVLEKIVEGRMRKFAEEICLLDQPFVKDPSLTVAKYIAAAGNDIKVVSFVRFEKGEGIEKKVDDFAAEVEAMAKGE
ncbi:MAG: elongation factor Ts [Ruminiclostridium sp.]|nr:elongation factor Ts [Ruminiclostridium sp.]MBR4112260.1 elongation factor Ts [Ruminiclostridium sp.]